MAWHIQLDWSAIVKEAIKRRRASHLTQAQVAVLAGVSKPTVVRFEKQAHNLSLQSAFAILQLFGLYGIKSEGSVCVFCKKFP